MRSGKIRSMPSLIAMSVCAMLFFASAAVGQCNEQAKLLQSDGASNDQFGYSVSVSGTPENEIAIVGAHQDDDNGPNSGSAYIYRKSGAIWVEEAKLLASDGAVDDSFGRSVSISGTPGNEVAIVGAHQDDDNGAESGSAYIFRFNGTTWIEEGKLLASDGAALNQFGISVSLSSVAGNEVAIVGAYGHADNGLSSGSAYIFRFNGVTWVEEQKLLASDGAVNDRFGWSVSISGATGNEVAIVGAIGDADNGTESGSVYVYRKSGAMWVEEQKLLASDGAVDDFFGYSVSVSGAAGNEIAIVGVWSGDDNGTNSGSAYIYRKSGATWVQEVKLLASDAAVGDLFGFSVSISGTPGNEVVIVGAMFDDDNGSASGSAYIYRKSGATWVEKSKLLASDGVEDDLFGWSVSISGDTAIVGAYQDFDNCADSGADSGSAYIFELPCGLPPAVCPADTNCSAEQEIFASDGALSDRFGNSVSISGAPGNEVAIVGAPLDDDSGSNTGSAYIYRLSGANWVEEVKLLASDKAAGDGFGWSVWISGDLGNEVAIVGAFGDDDNGSASGSAYIYRKSGTTWVEESKLIASDGAASDIFGYSVSISGTPGNEVAIVGAYQDNDNGSASGSAYVYRFNGATWIEEGKLLASDGAANDWFGWSVSIDSASGNEVAVVGAKQHDDNGTDFGSAYIYRKSGAIWGQEQKLLASDGAVDDEFGNSVLISGNIVIVGAHLDDDNCTNSGSAYIFRNSGAIWLQEAKLLASDGVLDDHFGRSVSIRNDVAFVGAPGVDDNGTDSGSAYIYRFISANWEEEAKILATDGAGIDAFGNSVSICGTPGNEVVIVAAAGDDDIAQNAGSAYILELPCALPVCPADTNCSGDVNVTDLLALLASWGPCPAPCAPDSNSDGNVNVTDLLALLGAWGPCP